MRLLGRLSLLSVHATGTESPKQQTLPGRTDSHLCIIHTTAEDDGGPALWTLAVNDWLGMLIHLT